MKRAALAGCASEDGPAGSLECGVVVADGECDASHPTIAEAGKEGSPVRLGLEELHAAAEDAASVIGADPDGREQRTGNDRLAVM